MPALEDFIAPCDPAYQPIRFDHVRKIRPPGPGSDPIIYQLMVLSMEGLARLRSGQLTDAIFSVRQGIDGWSGLGVHVTIPYVRSAMGEALALQGNLDAGLQLIDGSLDQIERPGWQEEWALPEILRLKGWMLWRQGRFGEAENSLRAAIDLARNQTANSWELRSSTTLAELLVERGKQKLAHELLAPIYSWFVEGLDTHDLKHAKALLDELS